MHIPPNWIVFFELIASFLVFWFLFSRIFFRPFLGLLSERERRLKDLSDRAEQLIKDARAAEEERERRLAEVRRGALARRDTERRTGEAAAAKALEEAKAGAAAVLAAAQAKIAAELKNAERELEQMGHNLAAELAERVLGRSLDANASRLEGN
ncbi:MAG: hypothetical protein ACREQI_05295 [Candidatus Binataceae bacterium]